MQEKAHVIFFRGGCGGGVCVCVYGGGGGGLRENERQGYGWVNKIVQKGYSSRVRVETVRSLYQFLNKHVNYS